MKPPSCSGAWAVLGRLWIRSSPFARAPAAVVVAIVIMMGTGACYRPSLTDGGLGCAAKSPFCPTGYSCQQDRCYKSGADASLDGLMRDGPSDRAGGGGAGGSTDGSARDMDGASPSDADGSACVPRQATAGCTSELDLLCDPVCQTGCCTNEKCTALNRGSPGSSSAALGCSPGSWLRNVGETCDVFDAGTEVRTDNCLPGLLCVAGDADKICMKLCRGDADCAGSPTCGSRPIEVNGTFMASVCDLPTTTCNPSSGSVDATGCPARRTCYLVRSSTGDRTECDIVSGDGGNGTSCRAPYDCFPGWTCPLVGPGAGRCQPVCSHDATSPSAGCPAGLTCRSTGTTYDLCL